jgi:5-methylcytosine-specific restriction protein B
MDTNFSKDDSYFILRERGETSQYGDKTGIQYHFRPGIPGSVQITDALDGGQRVKFVYYDRSRDGFFGIGVLKGLRLEKKPLGPAPKKVLIIDEINRGNLPKIFGELIYALEYRNESIDLQYREFDDNVKGTLKIPENLLIIGTMNTADRSIVLFDTAMRRRFAFVPMMPDYKYVLEKLGISEENWRDEIMSKLENTTTELKVQDTLLSVLAVDKINSKLTTDEVLRFGRERQIGQSYLINLIDEKISFINLWKYEIIPLLEEYYSSKIERLVVLFGDIVDVTKGISDFDEKQLRDVLDILVKQ